MENNKRKRTFFPELMKKKSFKKSAKSSESSVFLSTEALKKVCLKKEYDPKFDRLVNFQKKHEGEALKLEAERFKAHKRADREEDKTRKTKEANESNIHCKLDKQVDCILKCRDFFYKRPCPVMIPFKSTAGHEEHKAYLRAFIKFQIRPPKTAGEEAEYQNYMRLQSKFLEEQTCMMNFSYKVMTLQLPKINTTPQLIDNYISAYVEHRSKRVLNYSNNFSQEMEIPIKPQDPKGTLANLTFEYVKNVLSTGTAPIFYLPNPNYENILAKNPSWLKKMPPNCDDSFDGEQYLYKTPVSEDPNAEFLAKKHNVSIVMSASTFKTLVNNHDSFDKEWTIPVKIKTNIIKDSLGNDVSQRVAYLDKPFVKKAWLPLEKKKTYYKMAALAAFTEYTKDPSYKVGPKKKPYKKYNIDPIGEIDDSFGAPIDQTKRTDDSPIRKRLRSQTTFNESLCKSSQQEDLGRDKLIEAADTGGPSGLLEGIMSEQTSMLDIKPSFSSPKSCPVTSNISAYLKDRDTKRTFGMPWPKWTDNEDSLFKVKECPPNSAVNVHYQLFHLNNPKLEDKIPILIRHNIHGLKKHNQKGTVISEAIVVHPKIENQAYFGCEVNSYQEIVNQWATLVTKPNSVLLQLNICTETGTVIIGCKKQLVDVLREGKQKHIDFHPEAVLASLYVALQTTLSMPSGEYVLYHSAKTEAFIHLMKASGDEHTMTCRPTLNIHAAYENGKMLSRKYISPPWLAIDTHVLTPFHLKHLKVPATFPMVYAVEISKNKKTFIKKRAKTKMAIDRTEKE